MASSFLRTTKDSYELYSRNENSGVRDIRKETDSTENDDYRQSRTEASLGSRYGPYRARKTDKNLTAGLHDVFGRMPSNRCKVLIIAILVFSVLTIVAVITAVILTRKASSSPADVIGTYKLAATATNIEFTEDMLDPYSESFQTISRDFCEEIDKSHSGDFGYAGCIVTGLQNGSVIIQFTIEINESDGRKATNTDNIFTFLGMKPNDGTPNSTFGKFSIGNTEVLQQFTPLGEDSTVPTKVPFNGACGNTNTQRCKTKRSICKENVCACASDKIYVEDGDSCNSRIHFDKKSGTGIVGENYTMTCIVDNIQGLQGIVITKEDGTDIINADKVFTLTNVINDTSANLTIEKTIKCGDDGMYYCKPIGTIVEAQAETWVTVIWKSQKPTVDLSADIVEDSSPWRGFGTSCTGEIGYNNASIYFQTNKNGLFENLTEDESVVIDYNPSECSNVKTISFTPEYTADWNGTTFRCVVQDADRMLMDADIINVVPESICHNKSTGTILDHPFDCRAILTCGKVGGKNIVSTKYCPGSDACYNGALCVACEDVGRCREDPLDISPYIECTTTVATIGQVAYINCSLHHTTIEQPTATDVTLQQNWTPIIQTDTPTGTDPDTATYEPKGGDTTRTLVVRSTTIDIVFDPVSCVHKGEYILQYDNGTSTIEDTEQFVVQRTASAADLSKSTDSYYRGVETTLSCVGSIGLPEGSLELMCRRNSSEEFELLSDSITSTYDPDNCTYIGELHYTFVVRDAVNGYEYMCKSVGHDNQEFYSLTEVINVATPAINFEDEKVLGEIGTKFEAKCMISKTGGVSGATIILTSSNGTTSELCVVDGTFTNNTVTSQPGYTAFILDESDHWLLVVSGIAACHHEGTLQCFSPSASQIKSSGELVITRPSSIPAITVPVAFAGRLIPQNELLCTADVGYPSLGRVLKMQKKRASETSFVDDFEGEASGICEISEAKATKSNFKFELADNGTEYKCVVYDTQEDTLVTESGIEILRVFPNNCPTDKAESVYLPYPLDCYHRLWCYNYGSLTTQACALGWCFNATSTECDIPYCTSCPP